MARKKKEDIEEVVPSIVEDVAEEKVEEVVKQKVILSKTIKLGMETRNYEMPYKHYKITNTGFSGISVGDSVTNIKTIYSGQSIEFIDSRFITVTSGVIGEIFIEVFK